MAYQLSWLCGHLLYLLRRRVVNSWYEVGSKKERKIKHFTVPVVQIHSILYALNLVYLCEITSGHRLENENCKRRF